MKILVTTITRSPRGSAMRASREIQAEQIRIGRGAECELRLADPRVPLHARTIMPGKNGPQLYDASAGHADITGIYTILSLPPGTSLKIGPFQLDVTEPPPGIDLALSIELVQPLPDKTGLTAKDIYEHARRAPVSKRVVSWTLFSLIMTGFLLLPVLSFFWQDNATQSHMETRLDNAHKKSGLNADLAWSPGDLASAHQPFASECKLCHSASFTRVQDKDCKACHQGLGDHVEKKSAATLKPDTTGLGEVRCATCHLDHKGAFALKQQISQFNMGECSSCHADIKARMPGTPTGNVHDFAHGHPEFRLQYLSGRLDDDGKRVITRARLDATPALQEKRGLKFPHDVHLDPKGVRSPEGLVKTDCGSCHVPDSSGLKFKPVSMKANCQSCHELRFELAAPDRQLPHGDVADVMATLREFYSLVAVNGIVLNRDPARPATGAAPLPGKTASPPLRLSGQADVERQVQIAAQEVFEKTTCFSCHEVTRQANATGAATWKIAPVTPAPAWMPKARFSHARHDMASCGSCHAASQSATADDILMPPIDSCRSCHAGSAPETKKVVSNCGLCHGFHEVGSRHDLPPGHRLPLGNSVPLGHHLPAGQGFPASLPAGLPTTPGHPAALSPEASAPEASVHDSALPAAKKSASAATVSPLIASHFTSSSSTSRVFTSSLLTSSFSDSHLSLSKVATS